MPTVDTILFDLDGTLLYTLPGIAEALNHALAANDRPTHPAEAVRRMVGNGVLKLMERALPGGASDAAFDAVKAEYDTYYAAHWPDTLKAYPGVPELLSALRERGIRLGCVTNKTHADAEAMICRCFGDTIPVTVGKKEGRRPKPSPDGVEDALRQLGSEKTKTLFVGDSEVDCQTAAAAGLPCVLVSWGFRPREELLALRPPAVIDEPAELLTLL